MKEVLLLLAGVALGAHFGVRVYIRMKNRELIDYWNERKGK